MKWPVKIDSHRLIPDFRVLLPDDPFVCRTDTVVAYKDLDRTQPLLGLRYRMRTAFLSSQVCNRILEPDLCQFLLAARITLNQSIHVTRTRPASRHCSFVLWEPLNQSIHVTRTRPASRHCSFVLWEPLLQVAPTILFIRSAFGPRNRYWSLEGHLLRFWRNLKNNSIK
jgi:hypothetical protein